MNIFDIFGSFRIDGGDQVQTTLGNIGNVVDNVGSKLTSVGSSIMGFGEKMISGVTMPLAGLAIEGVKYNATMQSLTTDFKVMLGSAEKAGQMVEKLRKMGAATPFETQDLATATKTLLAFGYTGDKVIPVMSKIGDVSLGNNEKFQSLTRTMGQINALGKLQGGDLNQLINQGWNPLNQITKRTGETMEQVRDRMSKGKVTYKEVEKALEDVTSKGGQFYKGMEEGSKTFNGIVSTLKDNSDTLLGQITKPLFDFLASVAVPALTKLVEWIGNLSPQIKIMIGIFAVVAGVIPIVVTAFGVLIVVVGSVISAVGTIIGVLAVLSPEIIAIVAGIGILVAGFTTLLLSSDTIRNGIINAFTAIIGKVKEAATFVMKHINDIKNSFIGLFQGLATGNFDKLKESLSKMIPPEAMKTVNVIISNLSKMRDIIVSVRDGVVKFATTIIKAFEPLGKTILDTIKKFDLKGIYESFGKLLTSLKQLLPVIQVVGAVIGGILATALGIIVSLLNGIISALPNLIQLFTSVWTGIVGVIQTAVGIIVAIFTGDMTILKQGLMNLWEGIKGIFVNAIMFIVNLVKGFVEGLISFFKGLYDVLVGHSIIPDMVKAIIQWFNTMKDFVTTIVNAVKDVVITVWNAVKTAINAVVSAIVAVIKAEFTIMKTVINTVLDTIKTVVTTVWNAVKTVFTTVLNAIKEVVTTVWNGIKSTTTTVLNAISSVVTSTWNSIKSSVTTVLNAISSTATSVWNGIKSNIASAVNGIKSTVTSVFNSVSSTATSVWNGIKNTIVNAVNIAKDGVSTAINTIKNLFSGLSLRLPNIPLPHFSLSGKFDLKSLSVPSLSVDWYDKGGIFNSAQVIGVGEKRPEAVLPLEEIQPYFDKAVANMGGGQPIQIIVKDNHYSNKNDIERTGELIVKTLKRYGIAPNNS